MNFQRLYEYRFRDIDQDARTAVWEEIAPHVWELMGRPQTLLDPAAGRGEFINAAPASDRWAIDMVAYEEGTFRDGTTFVVSDIFEADLPEKHFDGIYISNFLEHLPSQEKVAELLEKMHRVTKPGGRIAIMGPNFRYTAKEYFDMADHTVILTHNGVAEHLYAAGFEPEKVIAQYLPYSFKSRLPASRSLTRRYLQLPVAWRLLGKQFLVIGRA
jgi:ubiquinone/menaquinone biosynthesis C-methylase UbiE